MENLPFPYRAFTTIFGGLARELINDCNVSLPCEVPLPKDQTPPVLIPAKALWDTGATHSAITNKLAVTLGLKPISKANVNTAGGNTLQNVYMVNIYLPNFVVVPYVTVTECSSVAGKFDVLIGMDIITLGDFSITNVGRKTILSYRTPSYQTIDYVKESKDTQHIGKKIGRNDPCPCGSGKKYKYCHGKS